MPSIVMRLISPLLMILLAGCSVLNRGTESGSVGADSACAVGQVCEGGQECPPCESCGDSHCNWFCAHGWCCHGQHPHYKRIPDNCLTKTKARKLAQSDLRKLGRDECQTCDYRLGFEQAYIDVSLGACGAVPALPPANYWKTCARTPEGHQKAQQWFSGYAAGAVRAKALYEPFNKVAYSQFDSQGWQEAPGNVVPGAY